jgi:hypothetical protein
MRGLANGGCACACGRGGDDASPKRKRQKDDEERNCLSRISMSVSVFFACFSFMILSDELETDGMFWRTKSLPWVCFVSDGWNFPALFLSFRSRTKSLCFGCNLFALATVLQGRLASDGISVTAVAMGYIPY